MQKGIFHLTLSLKIGQDASQVLHELHLLIGSDITSTFATKTAPLREKPKEYLKICGKYIFEMKRALLFKYIMRL